MATMPLPPGDALGHKGRLYDEFRVEIPVVTWKDRRSIRVSAQGYTTRADVERLVDAVATILGQGG
jgi:isopenicillin-N epimerase